jgi:hypothetical protein
MEQTELTGALNYRLYTIIKISTRIKQNLNETNRIKNKQTELKINKQN